MNPVVSAREGIDKRAEEELATLLQVGAPVRPMTVGRVSKRSRLRWGLAAVSAITVGAIFASSWPWGSSIAVASTPPALNVQQVPLSKQAVLDKLIKANNAHLGKANNDHQFAYTWWEPGVSGDGKTITVPVTNNIAIAPDGARTIEQTAEQPFDQFGGEIDYRAPDGKQVVPGTQSVFTVTANEHPQSTLSGGLATTAKALASQLKREVVENSVMFYDTPAGRLDALGFAILEGPISVEAEGAILRYLSDEPTVSLEGKVKDRLGRNGYMFAVSASGEDGSDAFVPGTSAVILDERTGAMISYETTSDGTASAPIVERYIARR